MATTKGAAPSPRTRVRQMAKRGVYDRRAIEAILDEGLICHVGFAVGGKPVVIPTAYGRHDATLYLHGSAASRMMTALAAGTEVCVTVTILDGLVLARSAFHHSMNYRSVVVYGQPRVVAGETEKLAALRALSDHLVPGRWGAVRPPTRRELRVTTVVALALDEASAKVRRGPPIDDEGDYELPVWAGVLPLKLEVGEPLRDDRLPEATLLPEHVRHYRRPGVRSPGGRPAGGDSG
jgi:uncharacterized protein